MIQYPVASVVQRYSLRKAAHNERDFWVFGEWNSADAWMDHAQSDHARELRDYAHDKGKWHPWIAHAHCNW